MRHDSIRLKWILFLVLGFSAFSVGGRAEPSLNSRDPEVDALCFELKKSLSQLKWDIDPCQGLNWKVAGKSVQGRPLVIQEFGETNAENTTLILSMVHPDEVTPLYLGLQMAHWLRMRQGELLKTRVIIAPLVNPDGFFSKPKSRLNANGVDVNRNFLTQDWQRKALHAWKHRYRSDPRRFPGKTPLSEPETLFQEELIRRVRPTKVLSIHAPLNHLDYDGPTQLALSQFPTDYVRECEKLRSKLRAKSAGYFTGSLGNRAGHELGIPTITLELPSADPRKAELYWKQFSPGINTMIQFAVPKFASDRLIQTTGG